MLILIESQKKYAIIFCMRLNILILSMILISCSKSQEYCNPLPYVKAETLFKEYDSPCYKNKRVIVTGVADKVYRSIVGGTYIMLKPKKTSHKRLIATFEFDKQQMIIKNSEAIIECRVYGMPANTIILEDCKVL